MSTPNWIRDVISEFGRSAGIESLALNERDTVALAFESGAQLHLEYVYDSLTVMITVPVEISVATVKRILQQAIPERRDDFRIRSGVLPRTEKAFFAVRLPHEEITLPVLHTAFSTLRRIADQFGEGVR